MVQAHKKQPKIVTEDLQPKSSLAGYHFTWEEHGLIAWADLLPINDQPARGFILECDYETVSGREPGARQIDQGTTLTSAIRNKMLEAMHWSGWQEMGRDDQRRSIWQHASRIPTSSMQEKQVSVTPLLEIAEQKKLQVSSTKTKAGRQVKSYHRTAPLYRVKYRCARCSEEVTKESQYPSRATSVQKVHYCDECQAKRKHEQMLERVKRHRASKKTGQTQRAS